MLLDNLFTMLGTATTSAILLAIVALVGLPAATVVMCPKSAYARLQRSL